MVRGLPEFKQRDTHTHPRFVLLFKAANFVLGWTGPGPQVSHHLSYGPSLLAWVLLATAMQWQRQQYPNSL